MLSFQAFTLLTLTLILAPVIGIVILLVLFIFEKQFDLLKHEKRKADLETELQIAKYHQLTEQINPHFMFNTLNVIISLARLGRMSELIKSLEIFSLFLKFKYKTTDPLIPIREEVTFTNYYIDIQKIRFQKRLQVMTDFEEALLDYVIPPFLLQTLVENAFKHALEHSMDEALLQIEITEKDEYIILFVKDSGKEVFHIDEANEKGHGLENIRLRLALSFPEQSSIIICQPSENTATTVRVKWPKERQTYM